jgi:ABC-type amino acid transport system permease subunit
MRRGGLLRRIADGARANVRRREHIWRVERRVAVTLPLAALVFALTVLAHQGLAGHQGQRLEVPHRQGVELRQRLRRHRAHRRGGPPAGFLLRGLAHHRRDAAVLGHRHHHGRADLHRRRLRPDRAAAPWISRPLGFAIEILAGIPSVVIGLWGLLTLGPILARDVYPIIANHMPDVPVLRFFRNPVGDGRGLLTAGIVLGLMIVPIIASTTRDLFQQVPPLPKEGAEALGMTDWEVARKVTIPWVRSGIIGATVLGLGRALGETVAVALVGGSALGFAPNIYGP